MNSGFRWDLWWKGYVPSLLVGAGVCLFNYLGIFQISWWLATAGRWMIPAATACLIFAAALVVLFWAVRTLWVSRRSAAISESITIEKTEMSERVIVRNGTRVLRQDGEMDQLPVEGSSTVLQGCNFESLRLPCEQSYELLGEVVNPFGKQFEMLPPGECVVLQDDDGTHFIASREDCFPVHSMN